MTVSTGNEVRDMYESSADSYAAMMDQEIGLPVYSDILSRLQKRIANLPGTVIDTACGPGHILALFHERYDQDRPLLGVDLSPRMIDLASQRLGSAGQTVVRDMCDLSSVDSGSAAAVMNFFAVHHLAPDAVREALGEWHRVLLRGGQLLVAAWEGTGAIDYGGESDIVALRYRADELGSWCEQTGFRVLRNEVESVEGFPMDAIYLECLKE